VGIVEDLVVALFRHSLRKECVKDLSVAVSLSLIMVEHLGDKGTNSLTTDFAKQESNLIRTTLLIEPHDLSCKQ
jgi:hypothetical protein